MVIHKLHKSMRGNYARASSSSSVTCECLGVERSTPSTTGKQSQPSMAGCYIRLLTFGPTGSVIIMQLEWMAYSGNHWRQRVAESADFGHVSQHRHWTFTWSGLLWSLVLSQDRLCVYLTLWDCVNGINIINGRTIRSRWWWWEMRVSPIISNIFKFAYYSRHVESQ